MYPLLMMTPHFGLTAVVCALPARRLAFEHSCTPTRMNCGRSPWSATCGRRTSGPGLAFRAATERRFARPLLRWTTPDQHPLAVRSPASTCAGRTALSTGALTGDQLAFDNVVVIGSALGWSTSTRRSMARGDSLYID